MNIPQKKNILYLSMIAILLLIPVVSIAQDVNNVDGNPFCDPDPESENHICAPDQTCQKRFRNILPSGPNPFLSTGRERLGNIFRSKPEHIEDQDIGHEVTGYNSPNQIAVKWDYDNGEPPAPDVTQDNENITGHTVQEVNFDDLDNDGDKFSVSWDEVGSSVEVSNTAETEDSVITVDAANFTNQNTPSQLDIDLTLSNLDPNATYRWQYEIDSDDSTPVMLDTFETSTDNTSENINQQIDISGLSTEVGEYDSQFILHRVASDDTENIIENGVLRYSIPITVAKVNDVINPGALSSPNGFIPEDELANYRADLTESENYEDKLSYDVNVRGMNLGENDRYRIEVFTPDDRVTYQNIYGYPTTDGDTQSIGFQSDPRNITIQVIAFNLENDPVVLERTITVESSKTYSIGDPIETLDKAVGIIEMNPPTPNSLNLDLILTQLNDESTYTWQYTIQDGNGDQVGDPETSPISTRSNEDNSIDKFIGDEIIISDLEEGTYTYIFSLLMGDTTLVTYEVGIEITPPSYTWELKQGDTEIKSFSELTRADMTDENLPEDLRYESDIDTLYYTGELQGSTTYSSNLSSSDVEGDPDRVEFKTPRKWRWDIELTNPPPDRPNSTILSINSTVSTKEDISDLGPLSLSGENLVYNGLNPDTTYESQIRYLNYENTWARDVIQFTTNRENNSDAEDESRTGKPIEAKYQCVNPPLIPGVEGSPYFESRENGYNQSTPNLEDPGVPVNIINQGPVPVDLFNYPNPINTNVVSPNPLPVRVIDDLPMYHQTRVDEAQAAIQQAVTTQQTANSVMREINQKKLAVRNPEEIRQENVETVIEDPTTGLRSTVRAEHGDNPEMNPTEWDRVFEDFTLDQDPTHLTPETTNTACGEGVTREEASNIGLSCTLSFLEPQNRPDGQKYEIWQKANENFEIAQDHTEMMIEDGYYPATEDGDRNPFTAQIKTPASTISETVNNTVTASLDQVIQDSGVAGDACWGRLPGKAIDGTLNPVLRDGILKDLENLDLDGEEVEEGLNEADQFIKNDLAQSLVAGANCEVSRTVDNILAGTPLSFDLESGSIGIQENINLWGIDVGVNGELDARDGTLEAFNLDAGQFGGLRVNEEGQLEFNSDVYDDGVEVYNEIDGLLDQFGGEDEEPLVEDFLDAGEYDFEDDVNLVPFGD